MPRRADLRPRHADEPGHHDVARPTSRPGSAATRRPARGARPPTSGATSRSWAARYISENAVGRQHARARARATSATMEGLIAASPATRDAATAAATTTTTAARSRYLSLRYGGKVVGLNNELNGLSLGGIGRGTDIHHIDIMNNVDDGIEIWGGTRQPQVLQHLEHRRRQLRRRPGLARQGAVRPDRPGLQRRRRAGLGRGRQRASRRTAPRTPTGSRSRPPTIYNCTVIGQPRRRRPRHRVARQRPRPVPQLHLHGPRRASSSSSTTSTATARTATASTARCRGPTPGRRPTTSFSAPSTTAGEPGRRSTRRRPRASWPRSRTACSSAT